MTKPIKKLIAVNGNRVVVNFVTEKQFDEILDSLADTMNFTLFQLGYLRHMKHIPFLPRDSRTEHIFKKLDVHSEFMSILRHDVNKEIKEALKETLEFVMPVKRLLAPIRLSRYYFASAN